MGRYIRRIVLSLALGLAEVSYFSCNVGVAITACILAGVTPSGGKPPRPPEQGDSAFLVSFV